MRDISPLIEEVLPTVVALRRELHSHPELAYKETGTAERILRHLEQIRGIQIRKGVAQTGIVATLNASSSGPCVALRADMDALPIVEETGKPYSSKTPGVMHACGHDGHSSMLVGAALVLGQIQDELQGPVKLLFQPAEEGGAGGQKMCEEGALDDPQAKAIFGLHCWPATQLNSVNLRSGPIMAASDNFSVVIRGKGTHAATPHLGIDPILVASHLVLALQSITSRSVSPFDQAVVTVGELKAGTSRNIIPETALITGTMRSLTSEVREELLRRFRTIVNLTAASFGAEAVIEMTPHGYPVLENDPSAAALVEEIAREFVPTSAVNGECEPVMGAEDFAFYRSKAPGAFWFLGIRPPEMSEYPSVHNPRFDFNDDALGTGIRMHVEIARRFSEMWRG